MRQVNGGHTQPSDTYHDVLHDLLHDPHAEASLVGTILADRRGWPLVESIPPEAFSSPVLACIWGALQASSGAASPEAIVHELRLTKGTHGSLYDDLGGEAGLLDLLSAARGADQIEELGQLVLEALANRHLHRVLCSGLGLLEGSRASLSAHERIDRVASELRALQVGRVGDLGSYARGIAAWEQRYQWQLAHPGKLAGLRLGWPSLDEGVLGGVEPGSLLVVASPPGEGKSILVGEVAHRVTTLDQDDGSRVKVAFFGAEMSAEEVFGRFVCSRTRIPADDLRRGQLTSEQQRKVQEAIQFARREIASRLFYFGPERFSTVEDVVHTTRYLQREEGVGLVIVDYVGRVGVRRRIEKRHEQIGEVSTRLKALAGELELPVIAVSQVTRESIRERSGRATLQDLAESEALGRDADLVLSCWRPCRHLESERVRKHWQDIAVLELLKGRFRKASSCYLRFDGTTARFDELDVATLRSLRGEAAQAALRGRSAGGE